MEIAIPQTSGYVGLRIFRPERGPSGELDYFTVEIADPSIRARARVYAYHAETLADLFESMARDWKGWTGALEWESLEGEIGLACTSDGLGHVRIAISLRPSAAAEEWHVHGTAQTEAGQLEALASTARSFFGGSQGAA